MHKALVWYTQKLSEKHSGLLTPAKIELIKRDLVVLQETKKASEANPVWQVSVGLHIKPEINHFEVTVIDETNVLYMDPE